MKKRRPWLVIIFCTLLVLWLPAVMLIHGTSAIGDQAEMGLDIFLPFSVLGSVVWGVGYIFVTTVNYCLAAPKRQREARIRRCECAACGYALKGNVSGICPECGEPIHYKIRQSLGVAETYK